MIATMIHCGSKTRYEVLERFGAENSDRIDRKAGIIRGVKLVGLESVNPASIIGIKGPAGRKPYRYSLKALEDAIPLYEGKPVNIDHPRTSRDSTGRRIIDRSGRTVTERFGQIRDVRLADDGLYGDLHYNREHELTPMILEAAERFPETLALSHDVDIVPEIIGDQMTVVEIPVVRAVDLIGERPGTTFGLFESGEAAGSSGASGDVLASVIRDLKVAAIDEGHGAATIAKIETLESELMATASAADAATPADAAPAAPAETPVTTPAAEAPTDTPAAAEETAKPAGTEAEKPADVPATEPTPAIESANDTSEPKPHEAIESGVPASEAAGYLTSNIDALVGYLPPELQTPVRQNVLAVCESVMASAAAASQVDSAASLAAGAANAAASAAADAGVAAQIASDAASVAAQAATEVAASVPAIESSAAPEPTIDTAGSVTVAGSVAANETTAEQAIEILESSGIEITTERVRLVRKAADADVRSALLTSWKAAKPGRNPAPARSAPPKPPMQAMESAAPGNAAQKVVQSAADVIRRFASV